MLIQGKIINVLPERGGTSQRTGSEWKVAQYVLETFEQFPKKIVFEVFGVDRIQQFNIQAGQDLSVDIDIDAHEYQGRWYNTIRAWRVTPYDPNTAVAPQAAPMGAPAGAPTATPVAAPAPTMAPTAAPQQPAAPFPAQDSAPAMPGEGTDDLPF